MCRGGAVALGAMLFLVSGCHQSRKAARAVPSQTSAAGLYSGRRFAGHLSYLRESGVSAPGDCRVESVLVEQGEPVEEGEPIAALACPGSRTAPAEAYVSVRSPFSGIVLARYADPGVFVQANTSIADLAETDVLQLSVAVPDAMKTRIGLGAELLVTVPASGLSLEVPVGGLIDGGLMREADAYVPNPYGALRPGMTVDVTLAPGP